MMAPVFQVLRCYECQFFQVHQVKKQIKWQCKLCGEKQSFKRRYGSIGTAKECRIHVQKLNLINGEAKEAIESKSFDEPNTEDEEEDLSPPKPKKPLKSKWKSYIDDAEKQVEEEAVSNEIGGIEVVLEMPRKKGSKWQPPTAFNGIDNRKKIEESTENCFYDNIKSNINHWHNQVEERKKEVKPIPLSNAKAFEINTSKVSAQVNISAVPSINKNSKWAQYVKEDEDEDSQPLSLHDTTDILPEITDTLPEMTDTRPKINDTLPKKTDTLPENTNTTVKGQNLNMFSLNDDINLDDFLDF